MQPLELVSGSAATDVILGDGAYSHPPSPQLQGWCSWCCHWQYHQLVEACLLSRDVYECQGCFRRTLPCRIGCGAFSRGFDVWDEERCALCQGRVRRCSWELLLQLMHAQVCAWSQGCLLTRLQQQGHCSWCKSSCVHFLHVTPLFGRQLYECSSCGDITQRCRSCSNFAKAEHGRGVTSDLCAVCSKEIRDWPDPPSLTQRFRSLHCSKCLTLQAHQPHASISESLCNAVYVCSGCSR